MNQNDQGTTDDNDDLERAEIERILRETAELEAQRRAENREFQEWLKTRQAKEER